MIAKGGSLRGLMAELYGKRTGCCKGKGGSMHIAEVAVGFLGANGVLTTGLLEAAGVGLAAQMQQTHQVCVAIFGDGGANRGPFHEAVNLAAIWRLPVVFVCENNWWASTTAFELSTAGGSVAGRAPGYGIPGVTVDGNDAVAVYSAVAPAVSMARAGQGPSLIEARTIRWRGHFEGDPQTYRSKEEVAEGRRQDPIFRLAAQLEQRGLFDAAQAKAVEVGVQRAIDDAVAFAEASPLPEPREALEDLFVHYPWVE